ncbi:hypothetical protein DL93DRAFT_2149442 [Clavulina sp. PMI_390]|nr:hypothetical protein DL93DRAFT_2149442 [Clavulina sp. PMI_390]
MIPPALRQLSRARLAAAPPDAPAAPKAKPNKSPSSLKRTASASLPIRANPTPTRGAIQPIYTFATAEQYDLTRIRYSLSSSAVQFQEAWWTLLPANSSLDSSAGEAWVFRNGTVVCWGVSEEAATSFVQTLVKNAHTAQVSPLKMMETEELEFVVDPAEKTRLQGDLIILGETPEMSEPEVVPNIPASSPLPADTFAARYAFSQALARSTALSAFETSLDVYMASVEKLPDALSETGSINLPRKVLIQQLGRLLKFRQSLNLSRQNFGDTPDFYWQEPALEKYFVTMSRALEIPERTEAMNRKITYAAEVQVTLRELLHESGGVRMELIIIYLIAIEVVIALIRDGPELWQMLTGEEDKGSGTEKKTHRH